MTKEKLYVKDRDIVIPGDILSEGMEYLPSGRAIRENGKIISDSVGLVSIKGRVIKVIPLSGRYIPRVRDSVIGKICGINRNSWRVDIRCPFEADLGLSEAFSSYIDTNRNPLSKFFDIGDYLFAGVQDIREGRFVKLSTKNRPYRKLNEGLIIEISPTKIPRIIGKQGSMVKTIKENSGCDVIVGQNGWIWIKGYPEKEMLVIKAIERIAKESHTTGLTDKIKKMLKGGKEDGKSSKTN